MDEPLRKPKRDGGDMEQNNEEVLDLDGLLHPAQAFPHPVDVVNDPDLTLNEKRAILASWASDACAIEFVPALHRAPTKRRQARCIRRCHGCISRPELPCGGNQQPLPPRCAEAPDLGRGSSQSGHGQPFH